MGESLNRYISESVGTGMKGATDGADYTDTKIAKRTHALGAQSGG